MNGVPPPVHAQALSCPHCPRKCSSQDGLTQHINSAHQDITPAADDDEHNEDHKFTYVRHPIFTGKSWKLDLV